jgi:CO/xanthine dehydrogenase Mo-binding subunit
MDVQLPGMLFGAVVHSPVAGGRVGSFDATAAEKSEGVEAVVPLGDVAVGVLARDTWSAMKAAEKVRIEPADDDQRVDSSQVGREYLAALDAPDPSIFREDGDA